MRIVPIGKEAMQALRKWIKSRSQLKNVANNSVLFLTNQTKQLTQRAVQYRLNFGQKNREYLKIFIHIYFDIVLPHIYYNQAKI